MKSEAIRNGADNDVNKDNDAHNFANEKRTPKSIKP
jgi:hypothetical protein